MPLWFPEKPGPGNQRDKMGTWGTAHWPAVPPCPIGQHSPKPYAFPVALASPGRIWLDVVVRAIWRRQCAGEKMPETIWWKSLDRACLAARRRCFLRALDKSPDKSPGITRQHRPGIHSSCQCPRGCLAPGRKPGGFVPFFAGLLMQAYTVNWCIKTEDVRPAVPETMCTISSTSSHRCNGAHFKQQVKK